jgi:hypothetical protein
MRDATQALTVLAEIGSGPARARLEQRLAAIAADLEGNAIFRPGELPDTHFMRFVIVDDPRRELPALLAWESNHDGRAAHYLAAVARATPSISAIFECCAGYPAAGTLDVAGWVAWIQARARPAHAFYCGYRGVPRGKVLNDQRVHDAVRAVLDDADRTALGALSTSDLQRYLRDRVAERAPQLDLSPPGDDELRWLLGKLAAIAGALVALPLVIALAPLWYFWLRHRENCDFVTAYARPYEVPHDVRCAEDQVRQNQLTHVVDIKPGAFRLATLWLVLRTIDVLARVYWVRGELGGITAIHFARWVIVPDRRSLPVASDGRDVGRRRHRVLFFSNYDGSWESYLGEFIDRAAAGLTAVWSNTVGFPATRHLVCDGARDEESFKQWTREHQVATQVWWSGVPDSTVRNVLDDLAVRRRLAEGLADHEVEDWLARL